MFVTLSFVIYDLVEERNFTDPLALFLYSV